MTFLAALAANLVKWLLEKVGSFFFSLYQKLARRKQIESDAKASVQPLKDAKTPEEVDSATNSTLGGI